jgi:hypothetical protein
MSLHIHISAGFEPKAHAYTGERITPQLLSLSINWGMSDIGYRIKVYSDIWYNVGFHSLQSDIGSSGIKLSPVSLITDIRLSVYLWLSFIYSNGRYLLWMLSFLDLFIQCCGSGMFIPDPEFFPSRIPDPKKTWGGKKIFFKSVFSPFCSFPLLLKQILTHNCCTFAFFSFFNPRKHWL